MNKIAAVFKAIIDAILGFFRNLDSYGKINLWTAVITILALCAWRFTPREEFTVKAINEVLSASGEALRLEKQVREFGWKTNLSAAGAVCYTVITERTGRREANTVAVVFSVPQGGLLTPILAFCTQDGYVNKFTQLSGTVFAEISPAEAALWERRSAKIAAEAFDLIEREAFSAQKGGGK